MIFRDNKGKKRSQIFTNKKEKKNDYISSQIRRDKYKKKKEKKKRIFLFSLKKRTC